MSEFTYDWFTPSIPRIEPFFPRDAQRIAEFGCFEGRSTLWFLENAPTARIVCVDHFKGGSDLSKLDLLGLRERFLSNIHDQRNRVLLVEGDTWEVCHYLESNRFDFVYVDGSHEAYDVIHDALQAFRVVRPGGTVIFDDYGWGVEGQSRPKEAIDSFLQLFAGKVEVLSKNYVVVVKKC